MTTQNFATDLQEISILFHLNEIQNRAKTAATRNGSSSLKYFLNECNDKRTKMETILALRLIEMGFFVEIVEPTKDCSLYFIIQWFQPNKF